MFKTTNMKKTLFFSLIFLLLLNSCGRFGNEDTKTGDERIVCIAKQLNEIIFELGAQQNIVAVDFSSTYPPAIKELPTVGYHRALSAEGIISMKPTLIIHDNNVGPEHVMKQLEDLKIPMKTFMQTPTIDSTKMLIKELGDYFHKEQEADSLIQKLDTEMAQALEAAKTYTDTPSVVIIHFGRAQNIYFTIGDKSNAAKMIEWAGGKYGIHTERGMGSLSAEAMAKADPDVILLTDFGYDRLGTMEKVKELPGVAVTKAAKNGRIYRVEEHDLIYFGPRTGENVLILQKMIHDQPAQ